MNISKTSIPYSSLRSLEILLLLLLFTLACRSGATSVPAELTTTLSAEEILFNAAERYEALDSFHFKLVHQGGGIPIAMGLEMETVEGDVVAPDRLSAAIEAKLRGLFFEVSAIAIGDSTYLTNPFTGEFEDISNAFTPGGFFDPAKGVGAIIREATKTTLIGEELFDGIPVFHLGGEVASESMKSIYGSSVEGIVLNAEIWIGRDDFLVRKLTLDGRITRDEVDGIIRTIILSDFDKPFVIEAPVIEPSS